MVDGNYVTQGCERGSRLSGICAMASGGDSVNAEFHRIQKCGYVPKGSLISNGSETFVVGNDPQSARVMVLNLRGEPVKRFEPNAQIDHDVWRSTRFSFAAATARFQIGLKIDETPCFRPCSVGQPERCLVAIKASSEREAVASVGRARSASVMYHRLIRRRPSAEGVYYPDAFSIRIESDPPLIDPVTLVLRTNDPEDFSTFVHEYWHYLQNLTTIAGFASFELFHDLADCFHACLAPQADGTSVGSAGLTPEHVQAVQERVDIWDARQGDECPDGLDPQEVDDLEVLDVVVEDRALIRNGQPVPFSRVRLKVVVELSDGTQLDTSLVFGQLCLEEGIAYEIDRMVAGGGPGTPAADSAPLFPYMVLRELARVRAPVPIHRIDLVALGTLALLTTDPAANFIDLLDDFGVRRAAGEIASQALDGIWQTLRPHSEAIINLILDHDLPSIVAAYQGRGLLQHAVEYLAENYTALLRRRLQDPFFDIRPFTNNNLNRREIERLFRETLPCDTIQSLPGDEDAVMRDFMVTFGVPPERWARLGYRPADFLRTLECQVDYLYAHLTDAGFAASADAESRCPFYTICRLPLRRDHPQVCRESPWQAYDPAQQHHCWYGTAVASTLGVVAVRSLVGDPSISERERAAIRAAVQVRAYEIWESENRPHGRDRVHWFQAKVDLEIAEDVFV